MGAGQAFAATASSADSFASASALLASSFACSALPDKLLRTCAIRVAYVTCGTCGTRETYEVCGTRGAQQVGRVGHVFLFIGANRTSRACGTSRVCGTWDMGHIERENICGTCGT